MKNDILIKMILISALALSISKQNIKLTNCKDFTKKIIRLNNETARENGKLREQLNKS